MSFASAVRIRRYVTTGAVLLVAALLPGCGSNSGSRVVITTQPSNQTVNSGQTATFTVVASGTGLNYQWKEGSTSIAGATSASYTTSPTTPTDNGSQYEVIVGNSSGSVISNPATLTVNSKPLITVQPSSQTVKVGVAATFTVAAAGTSPLSYQWQKGGVNISGATSASYATSLTTLTDSGSQYDAVVSNSLGSVTSNIATLIVNSTGAPVDVLTYQYDNARDGSNQAEVTLTPANVNSTTFGKIGFYSVDGLVDGQPLYLSQVSIPGNGTHNVLYVVSEHDSVYAFDADTGTTLWQVSVLGAGETTSDPRGCAQIMPEIGITSTPVIDTSVGPHGAIYTVAMSKDSSKNYYQRVHALDLVTGAELFGGPVVVQATFPGTGDGSQNGNVIFDPAQYKERAGLLLSNGVLYTTWASHCDDSPYTGWIIGYDESTLAQTQVLDITPNGSRGAIWMAGSAPAADVNGDIYFLDANGTFDTTLDANGFPVNGDFGNSFIKLSTTGILTVADYFTMAGTVAESNSDTDLGSGGAAVLLDLTDNSGHIHQLAVGAGKDSVIYVVDRNAMGKFSAMGDDIYQEIPNEIGSVFSKPAVFNNTVYYGPAGDAIRAFPITDAMLATTPSSKTTIAFGYPGATPTLSSNGSSNAILWAVENSTPAVLHAYDPTNLVTEFYNSNQAANGRDQFGAGNKYMAPIVVNGKLFVGTPNGVAVFGLLP